MKFFTHFRSRDGRKGTNGISLTLQRRIALVLLSLVVFAVFSLSQAGPLRTVSYGEDTPVGEYELKAVYLYNFLQFVYWPDSVRARLKDRVLTIGVVGNSPFGRALDDLQKSIRESAMTPVRIVYFGPYSEETNLTSCNLLFVSASERRNFPRIIADLRNAPVLTVGESEGFISAGGMIGLVHDRSKIRWVINRSAVEGAGLRLSSQILGIALKIVE